jgi:DNA-binding NtrC family response regulator
MSPSRIPGLLRGASILADDQHEASHARRNELRLRRVPIRHYLFVVPKSQGRPLFLVAGPQEMQTATLRALAAAELVGRAVASESAALAELDRDDFRACIVAASLGSKGVASLIARGARGHPQIPVLVLGSGSVQDAVDAMQLGAADYLVTPLDPARLGQRLTASRRRGESPLAVAPTGLVGASSALRRLLSALEKVSRYKTNVLILGESGTGKELIARALHSRGPRRQRLFVPVNCATLGRELLENELFGHEKGAFTGAAERKKGLFELADGGTLFLDEIAEMDPGTQAKLLRVLERNEFRRVGGTDKVKVDLGVVAATNRDLEERIRAGKFREDLYYRLKVVTLGVPPLRERKEDIPALIEAFIEDFNRRNDGQIRGISPQAITQLMQYDWPGNVRELKNTVESAAIMAPGDNLTADLFGELNGAVAAVTTSFDGVVSVPVGTALSAAERELILATLRAHPSRRDAARILGVGLRTLYTKLRQYRVAQNVP